MGADREMKRASDVSRERNSSGTVTEPFEWALGDVVVIVVTTNQERPVDVLSGCQRECVAKRRIVPEGLC